MRRYGACARRVDWDSGSYVAVMVRKIGELRATPDEVLIDEHDRQAVNTSVGTGYYMDELQRRQVERSMQASHRLAVIGLVLSVVNAVVAVVAVVIALSA